MATKVIERHTFVFNPDDNGGEAFYLVTEINQDKKYPQDKFCNQSIVQGCYGRESTITMPMTLTPARLRELANELESKMIQHGIKL